MKDHIDIYNEYLITDEEETGKKHVLSDHDTGIVEVTKEMDAIIEMPEMLNLECGLESYFEVKTASAQDEAKLTTFGNFRQDINLSDNDCASCVESADPAGMTVTVSKEIFERIQLERDNAKKALTHAQMVLSISHGRCGRLQMERDKARTDLKILHLTEEGNNALVHIQMMDRLQKERDKAVNVLNGVKSELSASKKECRQLWVEKDEAENTLDDERIILKNVQKERDDARSDLVSAQNTILTVMEQNEEFMNEILKTKQKLEKILTKGHELMVARDDAMNELFQLKSELSTCKKSCRQLWVDKDNAESALADIEMVREDHSKSLQKALTKGEKLKIERDEARNALEKLKSELSASRKECRQLWVEKDEAQSELVERYKQIQDLVQDKSCTLEKLKTTNEMIRQRLLTERDKARNDLAQVKLELSRSQEASRQLKVGIREAECALQVARDHLEENSTSKDEVDQLRTERDQAKSAIVKIQNELHQVRDTFREIVHASDETLSEMKIDVVGANNALAEAETKISHWRRICQQVQIQRDEVQRELDEIYERDMSCRKLSKKLVDILTSNDDLVADQESSFWAVVEVEPSNELSIGVDTDGDTDLSENDDLGENVDDDDDAHHGKLQYDEHSHENGDEDTDENTSA